MSQVPPEQKTSAASAKVSPDTLRNAAGEGMRIADAASQLSAEDLEQLRRCIERHHPKLFQ
jgi:hypothetical protein